MSAAPIYFGDLQIGRRVETDWHEMTRAAIIAFAQDFDPQPFHLTDEGGAASAFGRLVASGLHTFSVFNKLRLAAEPGIAITAGLGFDKLRFMVPVEPGDRLQVHGEVIEKRLSGSKPDRGVVGWKYRSFNQRDEPVMGLDFFLMVAKGPEAMAG
ncbi:MAG TPA: MaoC/PaaZ C-terminal domain-containing protein [Alphaproteobacteria bacterium]|nr:MaoC/PaaZ C-terminal domain-containing protein [Alphaproteobacteria bacterium]